MPAVLGLNALALRPAGSGVQTYIREMLRTLPAVTAAQLVAVVQQDVAAALPAPVRPRPVPVRAGARRALYGARPLPGVDLVHGLDVDVPVAPPRRRVVPRVTTVHDLAVFDTPWAFSRQRAIAERRLVSHAIRRSDLVLAVSGYTAERIRARFGRTATVTHLAPAPEMAPAPPAEQAAVRARYGLPERFVLQVGTVEPRKDVTRLADACRGAGVPLVLAGGRGGSALPVGATHLRYVPGADLPALYSAAMLVAYISRYEGFGLPPVEAMACRAPVIATRVGALPEIVGSGARLVSARRTGELTNTSRELLHDDGARADLAVRGHRHVGALSWSDTAAATVRAYRGLGVEC